jgi:hypothetical protein
MPNLLISLELGEGGLKGDMQGGSRNSLVEVAEEKLSTATPKPRPYFSSPWCVRWSYFYLPDTERMRMSERGERAREREIERACERVGGGGEEGGTGAVRLC